MSWSRDAAAISCPCGLALPSPNSLRMHLVRSHPTLTDRERAEVIAATRKILGR